MTKYLEHYTAKDVRNAGDGCLSGCLLAIIVIVCAVVFLTGCSTCPPCQPTIETVEVQVPVYSCPDPPELEVLLLPEYPPYPGSDATEQELKDWFAEVVSISRSRNLTHDNYIRYLLSVLDDYRVQ